MNSVLRAASNLSQLATGTAVHIGKADEESGTARRGGDAGANKGGQP